MPIAILMGWTVLRVLHWYGMATCAKTGWGTRQITGREAESVDFAGLQAGEVGQADSKPFPTSYLCCSSAC